VYKTVTEAEGVPLSLVWYIFPLSLAPGRRELLIFLKQKALSLPQLNPSRLSGGGSLLTDSLSSLN
jgi:hypothetical protein